jgi:hypothetical protein
MAAELPTTTNGSTAKNGETNGSNSQSVKEGLARMLKGGVIMDVVNAEQVRILFYCPSFNTHSFKLYVMRDDTS